MRAEKKKKQSIMDDEAKVLMRSLMGEFTGNLQESIVSLGAKVDTLLTWKPELESHVTELQMAVGELQRTALATQPHITIYIPSSPATVPDGTVKAAVINLGTAHLGASLGQGHGKSSSHRGASSGFFGSSATPPVNGPSPIPA